jgi:RNA polymerase sigma-70 factor (ECF subfamily)
MDDEALIAQAKRGDVAAYNQLVIRHQQVVYNVAYRIMGEGQSAEDVTQESFLAAYQSLHKFREGSFKSWVLRIATNRCYDELRRHKRRPQASIEEMTEEFDAPAFLQDEGETPEEYQQRMELVRAVEDCLQGLPEDQRITAVLGDVEGYDYNEIATITRVSLGTVKSRLSRARAKLRDCLQGLGELLPLSYRQDSTV